MLSTSVLEPRTKNKGLTAALKRHNSLKRERAKQNMAIPNITPVGAKILKELNNDQKLPVQTIYGPLFVVAGPGSGKTHCIISRAAFMIEYGIPPENMLLFTFTKKASGELKDRIEKKIGKAAQDVTVGTYHSFCSRLLRRYAHYLGYETNFSIYDTEDTKKTLKKIIDDPFYKPEMVMSKISGWKNKMITPDVAINNSLDNSFDLRVAHYYKEYEKQLKEHNAFDFDSLIGAVIDILQRFPSVREEVNNRYQYIFADEFQDSSSKDMELIRLLSGEDQNVCMILDDEQGIYGFRGADIDTVLNAKTVFPELQTFLLRENYRSTKAIVGAARSLISHNEDQIPKEVYTNNEMGEKLVYFETATQADEASKVTKLIMGLVRSPEYSYKDVAILYRMSHLSRPIEESLLKNGIPYTVVGGTPFYSRKEVKDIMSYIRFLFNPQDAQSFERIVNIPKRGIGKKGLDDILSCVNATESDKIGLLEACQQAQLKGKAKSGIANFVEIIKTLQGKLEEQSPADLIRTIIIEIGYMTHLVDTEPEHEDKIANLGELVSIASQYESIDDFVYNMTLNSSIDVEDERLEDRVQLLTMHASKGLEYKAVVIVGVNDGVSPHWRADTRRQIEEERRTFYVAMTRAEKLLFMTRPRFVTLNGNTTSPAQSRFLDEIDDSFMIKQ